MAQGNPMPGEKYLHFKKKLYQVIAVAYHSETMEKYVVYQALYGDFKVYIRPYEMFVSEVDHEKYPQVDQKYRFQYLDPETSGEGAEGGAKAEPEEKNAGGCRELVKTEDGTAVRDEAAEHLGELSGEAAGTHLNPWLDQILDAATFDEKYKIVCDMQNDVTDRLIDDIAVVLDLAIPEGNLRDRYAQLKHCIRTRQKYESGRLR